MNFNIPKIELSLKDPTTKILLISIAIAIGVYFSCQKIILKPHRVKIKGLKQKIEHIKLEDQIGKLYKEVNSSEKILSPQKDNSWLREKITELAHASKFNISYIEPLPDKEINPYTYISFRIKISCTYSQLIGFLYLVESNPILIFIENLKLRAVEDYESEMLAKEEKKEPKEPQAELEIVIGTLF